MKSNGSSFDGADHRSNAVPLWERIAIFAFGAIFVAVILLLALFFPESRPFQYTVFRIVLALAAAGVAALLPGFIQVKYKTTIRAGGALAVFIIAYFFNPAGLVVAPPQRRLTEDQRQQLQQALSLPPGTAYPIIVGQDISCIECGNFAADIRSVVEKVPGWESINGIRTMWMMPPPHSAGLVIIFKDKSTMPRSVDILAKALSQAHLKFAAEYGANLQSDEVSLVVVQE